MKKIYTKASVSTILFLLLIALQGNAQTNHTEIYKFMKSIGWNLSPDNNFRAPEHSKVQYYNFDSNHKYAIVAFPRNKAIKSYDLEALYDNGTLYSHVTNTSKEPKAFQTKFNYPIILLNPTEKMKLGLKVNLEPTDFQYNSQIHYMIFYR